MVSPLTMRNTNIKEPAGTAPDLWSARAERVLARVRELSDQYDVLLCFDEVIIGAGNRGVISAELSDDDIADTLERTDRAMAQLN